MVEYGWPQDIRILMADFIGPRGTTKTEPKELEARPVDSMKMPGLNYAREKLAYRKASPC